MSREGNDKKHRIREIIEIMEEEKNVNFQKDTRMNICAPFTPRYQITPSGGDSLYTLLVFSCVPFCIYMLDALSRILHNSHVRI